MNTMKPLYAGVLSLLLWANGFAASPSQPQNLQQAWLGTESLLIWDETPAATSYNIYRADETNTTWTLVGSSSVSRFRDPTFQFLPSYYVITAVNADGESTPSELSTVSDRKSTRLNSSHVSNIVCRLLLEKKKQLPNHIVPAYVRLGGPPEASHHTAL